ncbi:hypothetical protein KIN20_009052 [Parelaphostrongylus tenuis]|uniref:Uncharacterized protein n=1 Tax=Parelaphostrongylus tenuis TaxID=148309 RepID=A0AAD5MAM1_PARTN|nr:hypothetical protein KIN20_009052 [Parelaphostrongylus tenuis]
MRIVLQISLLERREKDRDREKTRIVIVKNIRKFGLRVLPKHHREKKQRDDEVERVRKERQMKREFSLTPSPDDRLIGNVKRARVQCFSGASEKEGYR